MKQITIVTDDKVGVLANISYVLGKAHINIEALSAEMQGNKAIINLTVKDEKKAVQMLSASGYKVLESEIFVLKLKDAPGELSLLSSRLKESGISIESMYLLARGDGQSINAVKVDKPKKAKKILEPYLVKGD